MIHMVNTGKQCITNLQKGGHIGLRRAVNRCNWLIPPQLTLCLTAMLGVPFVMRCVMNISCVQFLINSLAAVTANCQINLFILLEKHL